MPITAANPFKGRQYPGEVILMAVRWYLRYPLAYEHVSEQLTERGLPVDASWFGRRVQAYAPELTKRCWQHLKPTNKSYGVDETYIKVKGQVKYLYRAVDSTGQTIDFLLTAKRDAAARNACFRGFGAVLRIRFRLRQCKFLNSVMEQDHRVSKKRTWLAKGYKTFPSARRTLDGIETPHMIRKGRVRWVPKKNAMAEARSLLNSSASPPDSPPHHHPNSSPSTLFQNFAMKQAVPAFATMRQLAMRFRGILQGRDPNKLESWLDEAHRSGLYGLRRFAYTIRPDLAAVRNAITERWE